MLVLELPPQSVLLGALAVAALLAVAILQLLVPAAHPMLAESCRGLQRGRFWTRFLAISLFLALPLGVLIGFLTGDTFLWASVPFESPGAVHSHAIMLRLGIQLAAIVLALLALTIYTTLPKDSTTDRTTPPSSTNNNRR